MTIQVILADDQPLVRAGLRRLIEQTPDIDVAGEAGTGAEAVQLVRDARSMPLTGVGRLCRVDSYHVPAETRAPGLRVVCGPSSQRDRQI